MKRISLRNMILLLSIVFIGNSSYAADESFFNPTGNPVGGGKGYAFIIDKHDTHVIAVVGNMTEFLNALSMAKPGDIVYVHPDSTIDLTGYNSPVLIPAGVTIASNRGQNGTLGGRIVKRRQATESRRHELSLKTDGEGVRITGLRIQGPDSTTTPVPAMKMALNSAYKNTEVDNCEISGWSYYGLLMGAGGGYSHVHHCHISYCRRDGYGYPIRNEGTLLVEANLLHHNRHGVADGGDPSHYYEARYNIIEGGNTAFCFDMHGEGTPLCGSMYVHHNIFLDTATAAARLRSVPVKTAYFELNWLAYEGSVEQKNGNGNILNVNNWIGASHTWSPVTPVTLFSTAAYPVPAPTTIAPTPKPDMIPPLRKYPYIPVSLKEIKPDSFSVSPPFPNPAIIQKP